MSEPVIQNGRYGACGTIANASATSVQGRLASNEPSVPRALDIAGILAVQRQRFQAATPMGLTVRRRE